MGRAEAESGVRCVGPEYYCPRYGLRVTLVFFFQAEDGIRDLTVTGVQTCALPIFYRMRGISVAVFANKVKTKDGREIELHNISVQRRYRDGDEYKTSSVFRRDEDRKSVV